MVPAQTRGTELELILMEISRKLTPGPALHHLHHLIHLCEQKWFSDLDPSPWQSSCSPLSWWGIIYSIYSINSIYSIYSIYTAWFLLTYLFSQMAAHFH